MYVQRIGAQVMVSVLPSAVAEQITQSSNLPRYSKDPKLQFENLTNLTGKQISE